MAEEKEVCCVGEGTKTLIFACSGASNVGQITNRVMIELDRKAMGNGYCLAGIGAGLSGFIESARATKTILLDGCPIGCGKRAFEKNGLTPTKYVVITELGIEKNHDFSKVEKEAQEALTIIFERSLI